MNVHRLSHHFLAGAVLIGSMLMLGCTSKAPMSAQERELRLTCATVEITDCTPGTVDKSALDAAFAAMVNRKFQPIFLAQQANEPIKQGDNLFFPRQDWVFINSAEIELPDEIQVGEQVFKQYSEQQVREQGITHFLDILKVEQYGASYVFTWAYGMNATFGRVVAEPVEIEQSHRVATLSEYRSFSDAHNYMVVRFADAPCQDNTQFAYYRNRYQSGLCHYQSR